MTIITFEEDIKIKRSKFKNILDLKYYLEEHFYFTNLMELDESEITPRIKNRIEETKKMDASNFVNI